MRVHITVILTWILLTACAATTSLNQNEYKIVHIVILWLHEPENPQHIEDVINASRRLSEIPEVQEMRVGKSIPSDRPIVDDSFDVALYMIFNDKEALDAYLVHPKHIEVVKYILRPLASKILVYDFEDYDR